jgi:hypothetical protein
LTFAVKVTFCPKTAGFSEEITVVVVVSCTTSVTVDEVLAKKVAAPE